MMKNTNIADTYLHLAPNKTDKCDIFTLFNRVHPQVAKWVDNFANLAAFETDLHTEFYNTDFLRHIFVAGRNIARTQGQQTIGFGFPIVFDTDLNAQPLSMPLFIWYLTLKPHPTRRDSWIVVFEENAPIALNPYFLAHTEQKYGVDLKEYLENFVFQRPFTAVGLSKLGKEIGEKLGFDVENIHAGLREFPHKNALNEIALRGDIAWTGIFGIFPQPYGSINDEKIDIQDIDFQNIATEVEHLHEYTPLTEDDAQRTALRTVLRNKFTVIEGAHGTGKTHLAAAIAANALSNAQKVAIVSNDVTSLMQAQNEFVNLGIANLSFLLKDNLFDKKLLLDVLRSEQNTKNTANFDDDLFKLELKQAKRALTNSDEKHKALSEKIFGNLNIAEVVGLYLKSSKKQGRELLANHLKSNDYSFTKDEYDILSSLLHTTLKLYNSVGTLKHPLSILHENRFLESDSASATKAELTEKLGIFSQQTKDLQYRCIVLRDTYTQKLLSGYEQYYESLVEQLQKLKAFYSDFHFHYGDSFENAGIFRLRTTSIFSDTSRGILIAKRGVVEQYEAMRQTWETHKYFPHVWLSSSDRNDFSKLKVNLETFELLLRGWRKHLPAVINEEVQRLNAKNAAYFDPHIAEGIGSIDTDLEALLDDLNEAAIFGEKLEHKMLTLPKKMLFIEEITEKIEETQRHLRDFDTFFVWQKHWLTMPEKGQKLIQAVLRVKPNDAQAAFDSWYFDNMLVAHSQSSTRANDALMQEMNAVEDRIRKSLPAQIATLWHERKQTAIKTLRKNDKEKAKYFFDSKNQQFAKNKFLTTILKDNMSTLTDIYPLLLLTPQVASQLIESEGKEFDLVIFDNAQNIDSEEVVSILRNTEGVVVLTEKAPAEGLKANSLAAKAKIGGAATVVLNHLYRPLSALAQRINQYIFYPALKIPFDNKNHEQIADFVQIDGRYSEKTNVNEAEIAEIINILKDINPFLPSNTFPRVGVVCFTAEQRNVLTMSLLNVVQKTLFGWEKIEQLQRNGLGIFTASELAGQHFDILIVSGVFQDFEKPFEKADSVFSIADIRKVVNAFTKQLIWVNSIPQQTIDDTAAERNNGEWAFLLANLLKIAKAKPEHRIEIFEILEKIYVPNTQAKNSIFVSEIYEKLLENLPKERISTDFVLENQHFPLAILPLYPTQKPVIIRIDGQLAQDSTYFAADWERRMLNILESLKMPVLSVWSANWWRNANAEAAALVNAVKEYDAAFEPKMEEIEEVIGDR